MPRHMKAKSWSSPATSDRVLATLAHLDWSSARVADIGAGRGYFSRLLGEELRARHGVDPREHVFACDAVPASFEYEGVECHASLEDGRTPFADASFDAVVSIEVIEHVEDQFAFLRELARIAKPGATVVVTTPNVLNLNSRLRSLTCGFPLLYDPLPLVGDARVCSGHIHPITPYFLAYTALRAGLVEPHLVYDRRKTSAALLAVLLWPALALGRAGLRRRLQRKKPAVLAENAALLREQESFDLWTSRTAVLVARKPTLASTARRASAPLGIEAGVA